MEKGSNKIRYLWLIEDEILARRNVDSGKVEKYDPLSKSWVSDRELGVIYTGDVRMDSLTEEEAWEKINSLK